MDEQTRNQLRQAYLETHYLVETSKGKLLVQPNRENPEFAAFCKTNGVKSWSIITSDNPFSRQLSEDENRERREALKAELRKSSLTYFEAVGRDPKQEWPPENGFFVANVSLEVATQLGRKFEQNAIVFGSSPQEVKIIWLV